MSLPATAFAQPQQPIVTCLTVGVQPVLGPCTRPETQQLIPQSDGGATVLTNFGLLFSVPGTGGGQGRARYELVCDDYLGGQSPARVAERSDGQLLVPGVNGVYTTTTTGAAGCGIVRATGSLVDTPVVDVALAPQAPSVPADQTSAWALSGETDGPRSLHLSMDGGASFVRKHALTEGVFAKILAAPSDPRVLYLAGYRGEVPLVLAASNDGGETFTARPTGPEVFQRPATGVAVLGVHPTEAQVLLLAAGSPAGADEIWRSSDGGVTWTKVFTLRGMEVQGGFLWRAQPGGGSEVLIGGRELFRQQGKPPAHLYRSRDGGLTFDEVIPSPETGPRYRCLAARGERLYACAGENGDAFISGASDDGGRTWTALAALEDVEGSRPCAAGRCLTTAIWLCESYGAACAGLAPPDRRPESVDAATYACPGGDCAPGGNGCGCTVGGRPAISAGWLIIAGLGLFVRARSRGGPS